MRMLTSVRGRAHGAVDWGGERAWVAAVVADTDVDRYDQHAAAARAYAARLAWVHGERPASMDAHIRALRGLVTS